jgi:hypothetical protein
VCSNMIKMNFRSPLETGHHIANSAFSSWTLQCHWRVQAQEKAPTYLACGPAAEGVLTLACFMDLAVVRKNHNRSSSIPTNSPFDETEGLRRSTIISKLSSLMKLIIIKICNF